MKEEILNPRVAFFIDGFNLYHSVKAAEKLLPDTQLKWLDIPSLCESYLYQIGNGAKLLEVHYFTAYADHLHQKNPDKVKRHRIFVRALTASRVRAHLGHFRRKKVWSHELERWVDAYEEKETDVAIACEVLSMALEDRLDAAIIMTGDSDFVPIHRCFECHFPFKKLLFAFPFARASKELRQICPSSFSISKEAYAKFQFPDELKLPSGKFVNIPQVWKIPWPKYSSAMASKNLNEKVALITGGGRGIGKGIAERLAKDGAVVVIADLDEETAKETADAIHASGGRAISVVMDVTNETSVKKAVATAREAVGPVSILINNAGLFASTPALSEDLDGWDKSIAVMLTGALHCVRATASDMKQQGWARSFYLDR